MKPTQNDDSGDYNATDEAAQRVPYKGHPIGAIRAELDAQIEGNPVTDAAELVELTPEEQESGQGEFVQRLENPEMRHRRDPSTGLTMAQAAFLVAFRLCPSGPMAARKASVSITAVEYWRRSSATFRKAYADAYDAARGALFASGWVSAVEGDIEPVYQGGLCVGHKRKFSDRMREIYLKGMIPETFDRKALTGPAANVTIKATPAQIADVVRRLSPTRQTVEIETTARPVEAVERASLNSVATSAVKLTPET